MYVLDLTTLQQPTLDLSLPNGTKVRVTIPGTDMVREFQSVDPNVNTLLASGSKDGVDAAYDLLARVLSYNMEGVTFTGEDLQTKYKVNLYGVIAIYRAYGDFIKSIEKN
jgi:hypothetical protein